MELDLKPVPPPPPKQFPWGMAVGFVALLAALAGAAMLAPIAVGSPEQRAIVKAIKDDTGNPESVEVIDFSGPRNAGGNGGPDVWCYRVKYRAENVLGGMGVWVRLYRILPDGSAERLSRNREQYSEWVGWETLPAK